jgi:HK97 family phage major capsid protein
VANAIPLLEGTDASGGYLVRDTYGTTLQNTVNRESPTMALTRVERVPGKRQRYSVYAGRPTAAFVGEGAAKGVTGAEYAEVVVNIKKIATTVLYTDELLEDAVEDPRVLVNADVEGAFAELIDAHELGMSAGTAIVSQFDSELTATSQTTELGATADAFALSTSAAIALIEANGGQATGIVAASDVKGHLRDARGPGDNATTPVYTAGYGREPDALYGVQLNYSSNLDAFPAAAGKIAAVVGDFRHAVTALRSDITVRATQEATVDVSGTLHHLWQQNKTAVQWEMRLGFVAHDLNRMFVAITNAA